MGFLICLSQCLTLVCVSAPWDKLYLPWHATPKTGQALSALQDPDLQRWTRA